MLHRGRVIAEELDLVVFVECWWLAFLGADLGRGGLRVRVLDDEVMELLVLLRLRGQTCFHFLFELVVDQLEPAAEGVEVVGGLQLLVDLDLALVHQL